MPKEEDPHLKNGGLNAKSKTKHISSDSVFFDDRSTDPWASSAGLRDLRAYPVSFLNGTCADMGR